MDNESQKENKIRDKNIYLEYVLFLVLGFLLGIVIKTEATKRITIGYNDHQVSSRKEVYKINEIQESLRKTAEKAEKDNQVNNGEKNGVTEGAETSR